MSVMASVIRPETTVREWIEIRRNDLLQSEATIINDMKRIMGDWTFQHLFKYTYNNIIGMLKCGDCLTVVRRYEMDLKVINVERTKIQSVCVYYNAENPQHNDIAKTLSLYDHGRGCNYTFEDNEGNKLVQDGDFFELYLGKGTVYAVATEKFGKYGKYGKFGKMEDICPAWEHLQIKMGKKEKTNEKKKGKKKGEKMEKKGK